MSFLEKDYNVPQGSSNYMKFLEGPNKFRILSSAIVGYEYWTTENKPVRQKEKFKMIPNDIKLKSDGMPSEFKHFWAFVVWNYQEKMVQILEITQATVQRQLKIKIDNREGKFDANDFIVTRTGKGMETEYDTDVADPTPVTEEIVAAYAGKYINLEALYSGADPFTH